MMWSHRALVDNGVVTIDKGTDFMFLKCQANALTLTDITGYPKTNNRPFAQKQGYPLVIIKPQQKKSSVYCKVGLFPPQTFINK